MYSGSGDGSRARPHYIHNTTDLQNIKHNMDKHFRITNNLTLPAGFQPIGHDLPEGERAFTGTITGNGRQISGVMEPDSEHGTGLFYELNNATVQDIVFADLTLEGTTQIGCIAKKARGHTHIKNIKLKSNITFNMSGIASLVGGLIGETYGNNVIIDNCTLEDDNNVFLNVTASLGGIVGRGRDKGPLITNCRNYSDLTVSEMQVGGIIGFGNATVAYCTNEGNIEAGNQHAGGIGGSIGGLVVCCTNKGAINSLNNYAGGIVAYQKGKIKWCQNHGAVSATNMGAGGITGFLSYEVKYEVGTAVEINWGLIYQCLSIGAISAGSYAGGICGRIEGDKTEVITSYYDYQMAGVEDDEGKGEPRIGWRMRLRSGDVFTSNTYVDWDFGKHWIYERDVNDDLPFVGSWHVPIYHPEDFNNIRVEGARILARGTEQEGWYKLGAYGNYKQYRDIDMSVFKNFEPLFSWFIEETWGFQGTYDGQNHKISNINIFTPFDGDIGVFGSAYQKRISTSPLLYAPLNMQIKNLTVENLRIEYDNPFKETPPYHYGFYMTGGLLGSLGLTSSQAEETPEGDVLIENCHLKNVAIVHSDWSCGGFIGQILGSSETHIKVKNCTVENSDMLFVANDGYMSGGFIGSAAGPHISIEKAGMVNPVLDLAYNQELQRDTELWMNGGFIGYVYGNATIKECFVKGGLIKGMGQIGGFLGMAGACLIKDCYSRTPVLIPTTEGWDYAYGGFAGDISSEAVIENCYSTEPVDVNFSTEESWTEDYQGGFIGWNQYGTITNCYFDTERSGLPHEEPTEYGSKGTGLTSKEMTYPHAETAYQGWDFAEIWNIGNCLNKGYPTLKWEGIVQKPEMPGTGTFVFHLDGFTQANPRGMVTFYQDRFTALNSAQGYLEDEIFATRANPGPILRIGASQGDFEHGELGWEWLTPIIRTHKSIIRRLEVQADGPVHIKIFHDRKVVECYDFDPDNETHERSLQGHRSKEIQLLIKGGRTTTFYGLKLLIIPTSTYGHIRKKESGGDID